MADPTNQSIALVIATADVQSVSEHMRSKVVNKIAADIDQRQHKSIVKSFAHIYETEIKRDKHPLDLSGVNGNTLVKLNYVMNGSFGSDDDTTSYQERKDRLSGFLKDPKSLNDAFKAEVEQTKKEVVGKLSLKVSAPPPIVATLPPTFDNQLDQHLYDNVVAEAKAVGLNEDGQILAMKNAKAKIIDYANDPKSPPMAKHLLDTPKPGERNLLVTALIDRKVSGDLNEIEHTVVQDMVDSGKYRVHPSTAPAVSFPPKEIHAPAHSSAPIAPTPRPPTGIIADNSGKNNGGRFI